MSETIGPLTLPEPIIIKPKDEAEWLALRRPDITSTEVAALFGISPYTTLFEVWHRKHDGLEAGFSDNERVRWGRRLEATIAKGICEDNGWDGQPFKDYMRLPGLRLGASFDWTVDTPEGTGLLEIKNVDGLVFKQTWTEDNGNIEAPLHIEIQVQHQLLISGQAFAWLGALIGGNRLILLKRTPQPDIQQAILDKAAAFWKSIEHNQPPAPDFEKDARFITELYSHAEPGKIFNADGNSALEASVKAYKEASARESEAKKEKETERARILSVIGDAEKVLGAGWSITCGVQPPARVEAYDRAGFRTFRVNMKKAKAEAAS